MHCCPHSSYLVPTDHFCEGRLSSPGYHPTMTPNQSLLYEISNSDLNWYLSQRLYHWGRRSQCSDTHFYMPKVCCLGSAQTLCPKVWFFIYGSRPTNTGQARIGRVKDPGISLWLMTEEIWWEHSGACSALTPEFPRGIELQLTLVVTLWVNNYVIFFFVSLTSPYNSISWDDFPNELLSKNSCYNVSYWGNSN